MAVARSSSGPPSPSPPSSRRAGLRVGWYAAGATGSVGSAGGVPSGVATTAGSGCGADVGSGAGEVCATGAGQVG